MAKKTRQRCLDEMRVLHSLLESRFDRPRVIGRSKSSVVVRRKSEREEVLLKLQVDKDRYVFIDEALHFRSATVFQ